MCDTDVIPPAYPGDVSTIPGRYKCDTEVILRRVPWKRTSRRCRLLVQATVLSIDSCPSLVGRALSVSLRLGASASLPALNVRKVVFAIMAVASLSHRRSLRLMRIMEDAEVLK
jgi:hypothetical protein